MQILMSLPSGMVPHFAELEDRHPPGWVPTCDPPGRYLGSGGGTTNVLVEAWRKTGSGMGFREWLRLSTKLLIHSGGQSRRLPAYAATGKLLLPVPVFRWARGQRIGQSLLDLQLPLFQRILAHAPPSTALMVTCGDVLLRSKGPLPQLPDVDVLCFGLWVPPEAATHHGVFFCPRNEPNRLSFFRQKPPTERIQEIAAGHMFLVDTGVWLLSERAVCALMSRSGWNWDEERFLSETPSPYELYADFGLRLGISPTVEDSEISSLSAAVVPLPAGEFYHFGTSRELVTSCLRLQNLVLDQRELRVTTPKPHPAMFVQNTDLKLQLEAHNHTLWVENATLPTGWSPSCEHVLSGIPENDWSIRLPRGMCLDVVPVGDTSFCVRVYGVDDPFQGPIAAAETTWCGKPAMTWFEQRGIRLDDAGIDGDTDIQEAILFPVLSLSDLDEPFVQWLLSGAPADQSRLLTRRWCEASRLSASQLIEKANLPRLYQQRREYQRQALFKLARDSSRSVFYNLDLAHTAETYAESGHPVLETESTSISLMRRVHHRMFSATVRRLRGSQEWEQDEAEAFGLLREAMVSSVRESPVDPTRQILDDQIIWGRAPARLDLAGGWTDTPPYCLIHGGQVVNVAVNLNGQPPMQAFVKSSEWPQMVLRSIDLGTERRITTYDELRDYAEVGSGFSIAKAALALSGFLPEFCVQPTASSLEKQLEAFGGGIEISLLAAVPKGSGLGTSSILAATLLGTLSELCGLRWDHTEICRRTLILEQMLTTGGGWQDQVGGLVRGLKLIETQPGLAQQPVVRWLPDHLFTDSTPKNRMLLYYTGITRVAKSILADIVRGMFLNSGQHLAILEELGEHARATYEVLMRGQYEVLCDRIRRSWELNQKLDSGTNPPVVQAILDCAGDYLAAAKLLGAGGGGYMLMLAKDQEAALRIRAALDQSPPNARARFVDFCVSDTGLEVTRS